MSMPPVPQPIAAFNGCAGRREHIVKVQLHTGGAGPTVSFAKGGFYYGDKRDTAWVISTLTHTAQHRVRQYHASVS